MRVVTPEGASALTIALPGLENAYNALAAVAAATACGLPGQSVLAISDLAAGSGQTEQIRVDGRDIRLAPVGNASDCTELLRSVLAGRYPCGCCSAWTPVAACSPMRRGSGTLTSTRLAGLVLAPVVCGDHAPDLAVRIKYAGWLDRGTHVIVEADPVAAFLAALAATPPGESLWIVSTPLALDRIRDWLRRYGYVRERRPAHQQAETRRQRRARRPRAAVPLTSLTVRIETVELPPFDMPPLAALAEGAAGTEPAGPASLEQNGAGR